MKKLIFSCSFITILTLLIILFASCDQYTETTTTQCEHHYTSKVTNEATCTEDGIKTFTCSKCNNSYIETISATGHTEVIDKARIPTCTQVGKTEGKHCSVCKEVLTKQKTINPKGHIEVIDDAVEASCTEDGKTEGKHCSICKMVIVEQTLVKAKGHTEVIDKAIEATCTQSGKTEGKHCSVCNEILKKQIVTSKKSHQYSYDYKGGKIKCSGCDSNKEIGSLGDNIFCEYARVQTSNRSPQIITFLGEKYVKVFGYINYNNVSNWHRIDLYNSKGSTLSTTVFSSGESTKNIIISAVISNDVDSNHYDNIKEYDGYIYIPYTGAGKYAIAIDFVTSVYAIEFYVS